MIGCTIEKSDIRQLPKVIKPASIILGAFLVLNISASALIHIVSPLNWATALMCVVPGGVTDTPIVAADMGAETTKVALVQLARYFLGVGLFPPMIVAADKLMHKKDACKDAPKKLSDTGSVLKLHVAEEKNKKSGRRQFFAFMCTISLGAAGGFLGSLTRIPAGIFLFSVLAVVFFKLKSNIAFMPRWLKKITMWISGCYIGSLMTMDDVKSFKFLALPLVITLGGYIINCFITGKILEKTCGFCRKEAMLATTPAGASDIALSAIDMGIQNNEITIIQVFRAIIAIAVFPQIINILLLILP